MLPVSPDTLLYLPYSIICRMISQRYAIRQRFADHDCAGTAATAEALELGRCQSWATHDLSILFAVEAGHFYTREYANGRCAGKPETESKVPIAARCARSADDEDSGGAAYYFNWAFADELPAPSLGYPYMQTNYTSSDVCNTSTFSTSILFHADAAQACVPTASLNFPRAKSIRLTPAKKGGFHPRRTAAEDDGDGRLGFGSTAFSVSYFHDKACTASSMIQELNCPNHCDTTSVDNGTFFTSRVCLAEAAAITANTAQLVWISVSCFIAALILGAGIFVYMRRRAHGLPQRGKELWTEAEEDAGSKTGYSTF